MARINLETDLFSDGRFYDLVVALGGKNQALGALVFAFVTAQKYWFPKRQRIPRKAWERQGLCDEIITCGLAEENENGIYVCGSEEQFQWLFEASEKGKRGAASRKTKYGAASPNADHRSTPVEPRSTCDEPLTLSLSHKELIPSVLSADAPQQEFPGKVISIPNEEVKPNLVIAHWCDLYRKKYNARYEVDKKTAGVISQKCKQWGFEKFSRLFQCYLAIDEKFYREQKHPLSLFFRDIQKISVAAQTGVDPSKVEDRDPFALIGGGK